MFGGKINVEWPVKDIPGWAQILWIKTFGFAYHNHGDYDQPYPLGSFPFGPNYWIRQSVLKGEKYFDESIGPRPKNRIMGDEILFLKQIRDDGYEILYSPDAVVNHRIQPELLTVPGILKRAYSPGRGTVHKEKF